MKRLLIIFMLLWTVGGKDQSTDQVLEIGHAYFEKGDFIGANKIYGKAMEIDSSDARVLYHYAKSWMELMQLEIAARYFFKASLVDKDNNFPDVDYLLAESYRGIGDYRKARRYYSKALIPYRADRKGYWYKRIDQSKEANQWAMKQTISTEELSSFDQQFNTDASEYGARIIDGQLYFSSLRADSLENGNIVNDQHYFNRIYHSDLNKSGSAADLKVSKELRNMHLANFSLAADGKTAYFSVCDTNFNCSIWSAQLKDNELLQAAPLNKNINFPNYNNTQAEVFEQKDKTYLIFASDRPKGFGGLDLWISEKKDFGFDEAINMGAMVNTPGNEITPFFKDGWIYFSSDWHKGFGGYDIFKTNGWLSAFSEARNLGSPINSAADDYYFSRCNEQAILSSNRHQATTKDFCCNDLYYLPYEEEELAEDTLASDSIVPDVVSLNKYLPLDLFFHNDIPDPNSKDSTTKANYLELAQEYRLKKDEYLKALSQHDQYVKDEEMLLKIESFFEDELNAGISDLEFFTPLLKRALDDGMQIELSIKGFASGISAADYNLNLTLRRIESLINYFKEYDEGSLMPYLEGNAQNRGSLKIKKIPFGEFAISDQGIEDDKVLAVYSPEAARQRKIELIAVSSVNGENKRFDSQEDYVPPKIEFNCRSYNLGLVEEAEISSVFLIKNKGGSPLQIYNVMINCEDCALVQYPDQIEAGEEGRLEVNIDSSQLKGEVLLKLTVVSNTSKNLNELTIQLTK